MVHYYYYLVCPVKLSALDNRMYVDVYHCFNLDELQLVYNVRPREYHRFSDLGSLLEFVLSSASVVDRICFHDKDQHRYFDLDVHRYY